MSKPSQKTMERIAEDLIATSYLFQGNRKPGAAILAMNQSRREELQYLKAEHFGNLVPSEAEKIAWRKAYPWK